MKHDLGKEFVVHFANAIMDKMLEKSSG